VIRALLAVALAAALLAASMPAIESAATDRTAAALDRDIERIERAGRSLLAEDDPGARRVLTVKLPTDSLSSAGVDSFTIDCSAHCEIRYRLDSGWSRTRRLTIPLTTPEGPIRLGSPGEHRLWLRLEQHDGGRVVELRA
jgi:hypothetical protein